MQSTERQKFEESWKSAFEGAEMTPSDSVWNSIELGLAGEESARMKKRLLFYQRLAAATVGIALLTGFYAFYLSSDTKPQLAQGPKQEVIPSHPTNEPNTSAIDVQEKKSQNEPIVNRLSATSSRSPSQAGVPTIAKAEALGNTRRQQSGRFAKYQLKNTAGITPASIPNLESTLPATFSRDSMQVEESMASSVASTDTRRADQLEETVVVEAVPTSDLPEQIIDTKDRKRMSEGFWLALGGAAGNFTPNSAAQPGAALQATGLGKNSLDAFASPAPKSSPAKVGYAYTVGLAVGKKLGRVVLQTGLNLVKQEIEYTSNYASLSTSNSASATVFEYSTPQSLRLQLTSDYTVASSMEIVSIPVQAGYLIIDRKLGWQMNAGVSSDFFLRNTLVDKSGQRESYSQSAGDESPYRSVNWSGLLNTEVSYRVGPNFRLSLVPGVRYSFQTLLKDPANSGKPLILDVGLRIRYLLK